MIDKVRGGTDVIGMTRVAMVILIGIMSTIPAETYVFRPFATEVDVQSPDLGRIESASLHPWSLRQQPDLDALLVKAAAYSRKLEGAALDFICLEEIVETIDPSLDFKKPLVPLSQWSGSPDGRRVVILRMPIWKAKRKLLYDYQCIRDNGKMTERRTLLQEDEKRMNEPDAKLKTTVILYETPLLGPAGLFSERAQPYFDYAVVGREKFERKLVVIVEAIPKPDAPPAKELYGKAWIEPESGEIVKIEWSANRIGHYEIFEKRGEIFGLRPRLTLTSEFEIEKDGLRFPSRLIAEEAYLNARGRVFVRSTTAVTYKDFKFFTVEVAIRGDGERGL